jgi:hypothetical protein
MKHSMEIIDPIISQFKLKAYHIVVALCNNIPVIENMEV